MAFAIQQDLPSALRASVALAADRDAGVAAAASEPASSQVQVGHTMQTKKGPSSRDPYLFGSGGVICSVPTHPTRIRLR
jgi:hypothetical protein